MKKLFLIALALTTLCPKLYGTAHWYVFDGKAVHVISDSVRSLEFGLPPQHVCKLHTGRNAIFISAGHLGALMREPPRQTLVTVYSFDALVTPIMDSAEPIEVK